MHSKSVKLALMFLGSSRENQIAYLEDIPAYASYSAPNGGIEEYRATEICLYACSSILSWAGHQETIKNKEIINEILCIIEMALVVSENIIDYHMDIKKEGVSATGPLDEMWNILRRLVSIIGLPQISENKFHCLDLLYDAGYAMSES